MRKALFGAQESSLPFCAVLPDLAVRLGVRRLVAVIHVDLGQSLCKGSERAVKGLCKGSERAVKGLCKGSEGTVKGRSQGSESTVKGR